MYIQIPVYESGEIFDSKPLDNKILKRQNDLLIRKNLSLAFSQCISSYIQSQVHDSQQPVPAKPRPKTQRENIQKPDQGNKKQKPQKITLKKILETKKPEIVKLAALVSQKMYDIASSVVNQYKSMSSQQSTYATKTTKTQPNNSLPQSNKNFLIELFTETGLLKYYKGMDRTFTTLISEAQKAYYGVKQLIKSESILLKKKSQKQIQKHITEAQQDKVKLYDTFSDMLSMKKRRQEASHKLEKLNLIQFNTQSRGYETDQNESNCEILQENDYMILAETKDTRSGNNEHDESSISDELFFSDFSSHHFRDSNDQSPNQMHQYLMGTHFAIQKLVTNMKLTSQKQHQNNQQSQQHSFGKLKFY